MRTPLPWLSQGDIFAAVPILIPRVLPTGEVVASGDQGPAVLVTHDCALDKTNRAKTEVKVRRLFFLPLLAVSNVTPNEMAVLRRNEVIPTESLYIESAGSFGEAYCLLSEAYYLPADLFRLQLTVHTHPEAEAEVAHLQASRSHARVGRLDESSLLLLKRKWIGFWTRQQPLVGSEGDAGLAAATQEG